MIETRNSRRDPGTKTLTRPIVVSSDEPEFPEINPAGIFDYIKNLESVATEICETLQQMSSNENEIQPHLIELAARASRIIGHSEDLNRDIEGLLRINDLLKKSRAEISEKSEQLVESLRISNELKERQDGDYYLTACLSGPLSRNDVHCDQLLVRFHLDQYKKFTFRHWVEEIGGDFSFARTLELQGRKYHMVINADAMGKSLQGASGILVLGSVLRALVERSERLESVREGSPERWLKNAYIELNSVFRVFEGGMTVSAIMLLIEEDTNFCYYFNAGHPFPVLFRSSIAQFLDRNPHLPRFGEVILEEEFTVRCQQLYPGDTLVFGSDGRDDILLNDDSDAGGRYNEDDLRFLQKVQQSEANLDLLIKLLTENGRLVDDLSLVWIRIQEGSLQPVRKKANSNLNKKIKMLLSRNGPESLPTLREVYATWGSGEALIAVQLARLLLKHKRFRECLEFSANALLRFPEMRELLFLCSLSARHLGHNMEAANWGERVLLRDPHDIHNLANLARVYHSLKVKRRSRFLARKVLDLEPEHPWANHMLEITQQYP